MAYSFDVIRLRREQVLGILPPWVVPVVEREDSHCFAALEDNALKALAVFVNAPERKNAVSFRYIFVDEKLRRTGLSKQLLQFSIDKLKIAGVKVVFCRSIGTAKDAQFNYKYLVKQKFLPLSLNGHFMMYPLGALKGSVFSSKLDTLKPIADRVRFYSELDNNMIVPFLEGSRQDGYMFDLSDLDLLYAGFYVSGERVSGFADIEEVADHELILKNSYLDKTSDQYALPAILAHVLQLAFKLLDDETPLFFQFTNENQYRAVKSTFGEPKMDYILQEYIKQL